MINKTTDISFRKYGSAYIEPLNIDAKNFISQLMDINTKTIMNLYSFSCEVYVELQSGLGLIAIQDEKSSSNIEIFAIHKLLKINSNVNFNIISSSKRVFCKLIVPSDYNLKMKFLNPPYTYESIVSKINVIEIYGFYYGIKSPHYMFNGESHEFYELTYVDDGSLDTTVEGVTYTLNAQDLLFYGRNQFHTQQITKSVSCSYITIIFDMEMKDDYKILNRVFHTEKKIHKLFNNFMEESNTDMPYSKSLMICHLQEIILTLLQYEFTNPVINVTTRKTQGFQDNFLEQILDYIEESIYQSITVEDICKKFLLSRSSLQTLFRNNLNMLPKGYIIEQKLKKSKQLIKVDKYTISEISSMLGFKTIHYFSRTFKQHFKISPSEYAKKAYKD